MTAPGVVRRGVAARLEDSAPSWAASGHETALRALGAAVCAMAWGAGRCATGGLGGVTRALRPAVFVRCRLARRAQCRVGSRVCLGSPPFARCGPVLLDFSRSIIQQRHKNGVVNLDRRFTPYSQFFDAALPALFRTSKHQVRAIISGVQQGEGVQQQPQCIAAICASSRCLFAIV